jgi:drug/metabolite transporter (DMT)-like permease
VTRLRANALLLFVAFIWGVAFYFQKSGMDHIGPFLFVGLRFAVAAACLLPFASWGHLNEVRSAPPLLTISVFAGVVLSGAAMIQQVGMITASVTNAGLLTAMYVVVVPLIAWLALGIPQSTKTLAAVSAAFLGLWIFGGATMSGFTSGDQLILASTILWSVHLLITSRAAKHRNIISFTAIQFLTAAVIAIGSAILFEDIGNMAIIDAIPSVLFVGVLAGAVTFSLLGIAMRYTPASDAALIVSLETVFAALAGYMILNERLSANQWFGATLLFMAVLAANVFASRPTEASSAGP